MAEKVETLSVQLTDRFGRPPIGREVSLGIGGFWGHATGRVPTDHNGIAILDHQGNLTEIYVDGNQVKNLENFKSETLGGRPYKIVLDK